MYLVISLALSGKRPSTAVHVYWGGVGLPNTQCPNKRCRTAVQLYLGTRTESGGPKKIFGRFGGSIRHYGWMQCGAPRGAHVGPRSRPGGAGHAGGHFSVAGTVVTCDKASKATVELSPAVIERALKQQRKVREHRYGRCRSGRRCGRCTQYKKWTKPNVGVNQTLPGHPSQQDPLLFLQDDVCMTTCTPREAQSSAGRVTPAAHRQGPGA